MGLPAINPDPVPVVPQLPPHQEVANDNRHPKPKLAMPPTGGHGGGRCTIELTLSEEAYRRLMQMTELAQEASPADFVRSTLTGYDRLVGFIEDDSDLLLRNEAEIVKLRLF